MTPPLPSTRTIFPELPALSATRMPMTHSFVDLNVSATAFFVVPRKHNRPTATIHTWVFFISPPFSLSEEYPKTSHSQRCFQDHGISTAHDTHKLRLIQN